MRASAIALLELVDLTFLSYFVAVNLLYTVLLVLAWQEMKAVRALAAMESFRWMDTTPGVPSVAVIVPAYNEQDVILGSVRDLLRLRYPNLQVVVVSDGSSDATVQTLVDAYGMRRGREVGSDRLATAPVVGVFHSPAQPGLLLVDKVNGGKADAINVGLNYTSADLVCIIDADTKVNQDALIHLAQPFIADEEVVGAGGAIFVSNDQVWRDTRVAEIRSPRKPLAAVQQVEYLRAYLFGRLGWNRLGGNLVVSGAFGLFSRDLLLEVGGFETSAIGEDMELVVRLRRHCQEQGRPGRIVFLPDPVAWTEAPDYIKGLAGQRDRWHRGLADVLWRHRDMWGRWRRYGVLGGWLLPSFTLVELAAPVLEMVGLLALVASVWLGALHPWSALAIWAVAYGWGAMLTLGSMALDEVRDAVRPSPAERARMIGWALAEPFFYRPLTVAWRLRGLWRFLRRDDRWGTIARTGQGEEPSPA